MKQKDLKLNFRYLGGNIACLSVDSIDSKSVHNDINNDEAIIIFNSLVGEKENCQTIKTLLEENEELKKQLSDREERLMRLRNNAEKHARRELFLEEQQKEFVNYLEDYLKMCNKDIQKFSKDFNVYFSLITDLKTSRRTIQEILAKYKEIIRGGYE